MHRPAIVVGYQVKSSNHLMQYTVVINLYAVVTIVFLLKLNNVSQQ